jgi:ribosomal-protein-serine acetyltransferase
MLSIPSRAELRTRPLIGARVHVVPSEPVHVNAFWDAIRTSRSTLEPWLPWVPFVADLDAASRFLHASANDWDAQKAVRLAIQSNHDHRLLGIVSIEALQPMHRNGDLGYWLMPSVVGHGVMTEACTLVLDWAFHVCGTHRVRVAASTENARSLRVIERLGFQFEGIARHAEFCAGRWLDHRVYSMLATDARPR